MFRHPFDDVVRKMDYSQIKAQCASVHAASMDRLAKNHTICRDIYTEFASEMFGVPEDSVTPAMRRASKERFFCRLYSGS